MDVAPRAGCKMEEDWKRNGKNKRFYAQVQGSFSSIDRLQDAVYGPLHSPYGGKGKNIHWEKVIYVTLPTLGNEEGLNSLLQWENLV